MLMETGAAIQYFHDIQGFNYITIIKFLAYKKPLIEIIGSNDHVTDWRGRAKLGLVTEGNDR